MTGSGRGGRRFAQTVIGAVLFALSPATVCAQANNAADNTYEVVPRAVRDLKAVFGTVQSVDQAVARTRIGGTVESLSVDEGSVVATGEEIGRVVDRKLALEKTALEARIRSAEAQHELARVELERVRELQSTGAVSEAALDNARTRLDVARETLASLNAERAVLEQRQAEGAVLAPTAGRVLKVAVVEGNVVSPGETIAVIASDVYVLRVELPERHARFIREGDKVLVGESALAVDPQDLRDGFVRQVYPEIEQGRVLADVEVGGLGDFFVGERTRVFVATDERMTLSVPADHLFERFGLTYARLVSGVDVVVQPGRTLADGTVEILSGLEPGDTLARP